MGLATIDPHSQKEHTEIPKIPMFGVTNPDFFRICPHFHTFLCEFFSFLNARISVKTSLINTKLEDFGNLGVLLLIMGINSC